jgi:hypothetical protein
MKEIYQYQQRVNERLQHRGVKLTVTYADNLLSFSFDKGEENLYVFNCHPDYDWRQPISEFLMDMAMLYMIEKIALAATFAPTP